MTFTASLSPSSSPLTVKEGLNSAAGFAVVVTFVPAAIFATTSLSTMNTDTEASTPMSFSESSSVSVPSAGSVPAVEWFSCSCSTPARTATVPAVTPASRLPIVALTSELP